MILSCPGRSQIVGFRNRIVHEYAEVDTEIVWAVAQNEVPDFSKVAMRDPHLVAKLSSLP